MLNTARYRVVGRFPQGRRRLEAWGDRRAREVVASYFAGDVAALGTLRT